MVVAAAGMDLQAERVEKAVVGPGLRNRRSVEMLVLETAYAAASIRGTFLPSQETYWLDWADWSSWSLRLNFWQRV